MYGFLVTVALATFVALSIVIGIALSTARARRNSRLVYSLEAVGHLPKDSHEVTESPSAPDNYDEYDVIIVGGGALNPL